MSEALHTWLGMIGGKNPDAWLEVRELTDSRKMRSSFWPADRLTVLADQLTVLGAKRDVFVGVAPRARQRGRACDVAEIRCLWADCDTPEAVAALRQFKPRPTMVVSSGSETDGEAHLHAYWALRAPVDAVAGRRANERLAAALGADPRCVDPPRILRPPGTRNHKPDAGAVWCRYQAAVDFTVADVVGLLPPPPGFPTRECKPIPRKLHGALAEIPATDYIPALTGRRVGFDGKVQCPFHGGGQERTPSLHAWDDPKRGWYCWGCSEGGTIIGFAGRLWDIEPRGADWHRVRERLVEVFR